MTIAGLFICILCLLYLLYLGAEKLLARRYRRSLLHVIQVNGIRGKSSTVRLIDAGLRAGGFRVVSKSTGTLPMILHTDGREEEIRRRAPANIREQLSLLAAAHREGAQIAVCECMAISPELQRASQQMLQADIALITNVRLDHTDVMGATREEICASLLHMAPEKGLLITGEEDMLPFMQAAMKKRRGRAKLALPDAAGYPGIPDFPENIALALAACEAAGVSRAAALKGMESVRRDPYAFERLQWGHTVFLNAFSANDVQSTRTLYEKSGEKAPLILILNNRKDRPARALEMSRLARLLPFREIWILGEQKGLMQRLLRRQNPSVPLRRFDRAEDIPLDFSEPRVLLGAGNIKGQGEALTLRIRRRAKEVE